MKLALLIAIWIYFCATTIRRSHCWTTPLRLWQQAYADGSRKLRVLVNLNYAYQHSGDFQQASIWAKRALDIQPQLLPVKMNVATALSAQGRTDEAIQVLNDAVQGTPLIWQAWKVLGSLYEQKGEWMSALGAYTRAVELYREDAELYNHVGAMRVKLNAWEQALQPFETAYRLNPDNASYAYNIAMLYFKDGKRELALEWYKRIPENATMPDELSKLLDVEVSVA